MCKRWDGRLSRLLVFIYNLFLTSTAPLTTPKFLCLHSEIAAIGRSKHPPPPPYINGGKAHKLEAFRKASRMAGFLSE